MPDLILYQFSRDRVEAGDFRHFMGRFGLASLPRGRRLAEMMGCLNLFVEGYDGDTREIHSIPEVRAFYTRLHRAWPSWFYFCSLEAENLLVMTMCCLNDLRAGKVLGRERVSVSMDPMELALFVRDGFGPMNAMCERAGMDEGDIFRRTAAVFAYYGLPFDAAPPGA